MDTAIAHSYKSAAQIARVVSESWATRELFCCACSSDSLPPAPNNTRTYDFICPACQRTYQLKSGNKRINDRITDGEYQAMHNAITNGATPNLLVLQYARPAWTVQNLLLVPSFFFTLSAVEKRNPLSPTARRAG